MNIHKDDTVLVIAGKDKGKKGKVRRALPREDRVVVEGVNVVKRHMRARAMTRQAGIIEREMPVHVSNVMLVCGKCNHPTRVGSAQLKGGNRVRTCRRCGEVID
ncbi:MAG: 50S ribosomal protein L24 [Chloroflexota bacterium]|nr:50S ribosomal protein L24 [Chloroflexota bacterium]